MGERVKELLANKPRLNVFDNVAEEIDKVIDMVCEDRGKEVAIESAQHVYVALNEMMIFVIKLLDVIDSSKRGGLEQ